MLVRFDLSQPTAAALLEALAWPPGDDRRRLLERLLVADPFFAAWSRDQAGRLTGEAAPSSETLAVWLDEHLLNLPLVGDAATGGESPTHQALRQLLAQLRGLRDLRSQFNERLETAKLAAMRELAYGASHEINNPLANIASRAQTLIKDEQDPERRRKLGIINQQAFRAFEMIADLMLFAKPPAPNKELVDLRGLIGVVLDELADDATAQGTEIRRDLPAGPVEVQADRTQIEMALRSLVRNSLEALGAGGQIHVAARWLDSASPSENSAAGTPWAEVVVTDTGPGIPPQARPHLFDPYYSGREAGRGLGLGLSKCWRIAELHGGRILADDPPVGAQFRLHLPAESL